MGHIHRSTCSLILFVSPLLTLLLIELTLMIVAFSLFFNSQLVVPEILAFGLLVLIHIVTLNWILVATNFPMLMYIAYKYYSVPRGNIGMFDPAEIYNKDKMRSYLRQYLVKIVFHVLHSVAYMYLALIALITI